MKENNENRVPHDLIAAMLSGEASDQELMKFDHWIEQSEENQKLFSEYKKLWEKSARIKLSDKIDLNLEWERFKKERPSGKEKRILPLIQKFAVAASVIIVLGLSGIFGYNTLKFEKVIAGTETEIIELPDGSLASLYPGSGLRYPKKFTKQSRPVKLEGEAFFEVIKDSLRTFSVSSSEMIVKVMGTSFNVEAFSEENIFKVVVEEGKVAVSDKDEKSTEYLLPGQKASFNRGAEKILKTINTDINFNAWRTRSIIFENSNINDVAETLSKAYFIEILVETKAQDQNISVSFEDRSLDYVLNTIEATLDVEIVKENNRILIK